MDGEQKPRQLSRDFHVALSKKSTLRTVLSSWNGRQYTDDEFRELDLFDQLGLPCQLNVVLNDTGEYANVDSVIPLPRGMPVPTTSSALPRWDMDQWSDETFGELPEWVQEKIKKSTQYQQTHAPSDPVDFPPGGAVAPSAASGLTSSACSLHIGFLPLICYAGIWIELPASDASCICITFGSIGLSIEPIPISGVTLSENRGCSRYDG